MKAHYKMTREEMQRAIEAGRTAAAVFWREGLQSLVEIWRYEGEFILTWEEAPDGAQYDESRYTRNERHVFAAIEEAFAFLDQHSVDIAHFELPE